MATRYKLADGTLLEEANLSRGDSYTSISNQVYAALNTQIRKGADMDLDGDGDADMNDYAYIVDLYPNVAIYSMNGRLFSIKYTINKDAVSLGTPVKVEVCYAPVKESERVPVAAGMQLGESAYNRSTGKLTITVIKPGFNTSKSRFYTESALKKGHKVFEGAKMFVNHQTTVEEKARPEGDVNQWVANLTKTWVESDGTIMGEAVVIDPTFKTKLDNLADSKLLGEMGISIRAIGEAHEDEVGGVRTNVVESFLAARSVDFVTYPGAGGRVETIEADRSEDRNDVDLVNLAELSKRRPDLVQLIESKITQEHSNMKTVAELEKELKESQDALTAANLKVQESEKATKKVAAAAELAKLLTESKLPDAAQTRLKAQFKEATEVTGMAEAITAEKKYIADLNPAAGTRTGVTNMGESHSGTDDAALAATQTKLQESFAKLPGMSKEESAIAAAGRR
jgi:hypothetical protein